MDTYQKIVSELWKWGFGTHKKPSLIMFPLNIVDYTRFFLLLFTLTWDTFLTLRGTCFYLNNLIPPKLSKSYIA